MARTNQEAVTAFGEVLRSANVSGSYNSPTFGSDPLKY